MSAQTDDQTPAILIRTILCAFCRTKKTTWKRTTRFCSDRCARRYRAPNGAKWLPLRSCTVCATEFEPLMVLHDLCSPECRRAMKVIKDAAAREAARAEKEAEKARKASAKVVRGCATCRHWTVLPAGVSETGGMCALNMRACDPRGAVKFWGAKA